jgi:hypothetical protein
VVEPFRRVSGVDGGPARSYAWRMLIRFILGVVTTVATVALIFAFPTVLVVLLGGGGVAFGWWGARELRAGRRGFRSIFAVCLAPTLVLAALIGVFAFAPVGGPSPQPSNAVNISHQ